MVRRCTAATRPSDERVKAASQSAEPQAGEVFLLPGQWHFGPAPGIVRTVLGSCVSITLWHPGRRLGGMCHYMLASSSNRPGANPADLGRYADGAFSLLMDAIARHGTRPREYVAKVFGGGRMFETISTTASRIPEANVMRAFELLQAEGIPVLAEHVGGAGSRSLAFDLDTGEVWLRFMGTPPA